MAHYGPIAWTEMGAQFREGVGPGLSGLAREFEGQRVGGVALEETLENRESLAAAIRVDVDLGERHIGVLDLRVLFEEVLEKANRVVLLAACDEHEGQVIGDL